MIALLYFCSLFLLLSWKQVSTCSQVQGSCRELAFPSFLFFANKRLLNHRIRVLQVQDLDECELRCYHEHNCVSINFKFKMLARGKYSCELNNSTHGEHERDLVPDQDHFYRGTKNVCSNSPCQNNGTCQSGFTKKGYRCLCPDGWTGGTCNMDIDECDEKSHKCSKNATCINKKGSYKCKCKHGFHGDGYNCTDIDECQKQDNKCSKNATCTNTDGSYGCNCNTGFFGDGFNCTVCHTIFDFEDHDLSNWTLTGTAFINQPTYGDNPSERFKENPNRKEPSNHQGNWWIGTYENRSSPSHPAGEKQDDKPQGSMTSPGFLIDANFLTFLIGAGCQNFKTRAELIVDGDVVFKTKAERHHQPKRCMETMVEKKWNVSGFTGSQAQLRLIDNSSGDWGHINFDHLQACYKLP